MVNCWQGSSRRTLAIDDVSGVELRRSSSAFPCAARAVTALPACFARFYSDNLQVSLNFLIKRRNLMSGTYTIFNTEYSKTEKELENQ